MKIYIFVIITLSVMLTSCFNEPNYPDTPSIEFSHIQSYARPGKGGDSIPLVISFRDGDGDLGEDDTTKKNCLVTAFKKQDGRYTQIVFLTPDDLSGTFPRLNTGSSSSLEGDITYKMEFYYMFTGKYRPTLKVKDTVKFRVQISDRAGNLSNTVETSDVVLGVNP